MMPLTYRERQIIYLVSKGYTAKEIARFLDLGYRTIEKYTLTMRKKLRARNMSHAVTLALQCGVIRLDDFPKVLH